MSPAPIRPGWALVAIVILWGLAGALDQPPIDGGPFVGSVIDPPAPGEPPLRLRCHLEPDGPEAPQPGYRRGDPPIRLVSLRGPQEDPHRPPEWLSRSLRCFVVDE